MHTAKSKYVKIGEAAKALGIHIDTLRRWEKSGRIKTFRTPGGTRLYSLELLDQLKPKSPEEQPFTTEELLDKIEQAKTQDLISDIQQSPASNFQYPTLSNQIYANPSIIEKIYAKIYESKIFLPVLSTIIITSVAGIVLSSQLRKENQLPPVNSNVLATTTALKFLEINSPVQVSNSLDVKDAINGLIIQASPSASTFSLSSGNAVLDISGSVSLDQDVSSTATPTFNTLNLSASSNQLVLQSGGPTGTLTWTPTSAKIITLPDKTGEVSVLGQTISNSELDNSSITVSSGTNLTGGGSVSLGGSTTLSLKDSISLAGTLAVTGATTLSSTLAVTGATTLTSTSLSIGSVAYTWPSADGSSSTVLSTNGSGTLSWGSLATAGGWTDDGTVVRLSTITDNVGVGTTTANSTFSVSGNAHIGSLRQGFSAPTNGLFVDGNVGIGATTSSNNLDVWGSARITGALTIDGSCTGCGGLSGGTSGQVVFFTSANTAAGNNAFFWNNGLNRLGIGSSAPGSTLGVFGNVGIGTSYAGIPLDSTLANGLAIQGNIGVGKSTTSFNLDIAGSAGIGTSLTVTSLINTTGLNVSGTSVLGTGYASTLTVSGNTGVGGSLTTTGLDYASGGLRVNGFSDLTGNVGIGGSLTANSLSYFNSSILGINGSATTPTYSFINSTSTGLWSPYSNALSLTTNGSANNGININPSGNVGIGTTVPNATLAIQGNVGIGFTGASSVIPSNGLAVSGNVGIGATTANSTLSVAGNAHIGSLRQGFSAPTNGLFVDGNVGIGATTSSNPLDVWGATRIAGTLTLDGNGLIGYGGASVTGPTSGLAINGNVGVGTTTAQGALHVVGQCVAEGTRIRRRRKNSKGELEEEDIPVEDIKPDDEILSLNDQTGEWEWHKVEETMGKGIQTVYRLETESGKYIDTTAEHPYLVRDHLFEESNVEQNQSNNRQYESKNSSGIGINDIEFLVHNELLSATALNKQSIASTISPVNTPYLFQPFSLEKFGTIMTAANQPADKLINRSAIMDRQIGLSSSISSTLSDDIITVKQAKWIKVSQIKSGMEVATIDGWEKIVAISKVGRVQTYDLQIANTHNFLANGIVAHNTYLQGSLGIGDAFRGTTTPVNGLGIQGNLGVGASTANNALSVAGAINIGNRLGATSPLNGALISGNVGIGTTGLGSSSEGTFNLDVWGSGRFTGALTLDGNLGIGRSITSANLINTTGLRVSGFADLGGNVGVGSSITSNGNIYTPLGLKVGGFSDLAGNLGVGGSINVTSANGLINTINLNVSGTSSLGTAFASSLTSSGNLGVGGSLTVTSAGVFSTLGSGIVQSNASGGLSSGPVNLGSSTFVSGILGVSNGGSGTSTQFTQGSVVFAGANGIYTQNSTGFFFDNTNLRLGIGASAPGGKLGVFGSVGIGSSYGYAILPSSLNNGLAVEGNVGIGYSSAAGALVVNGNVGIGTTSPVAPLHVWGNGQNSAFFLNGNVGIGASAPYQLFQVNQAEANAFIVDSNGNVGIGITTNTTASLLIRAGDDNEPANLLSLQTSSGINTLNVTNIGFVTMGYASSNNNMGANTLLNVGNNRMNSTADFVKINPESTQIGNILNILKGTLPLLTLNASGNLGLGVSVPNATLNVQGNVGIGYTGPNLVIPSNGLAVSGNVGVGTTTAQGALHVIGQCVTGDTRLRRRRKSKKSNSKFQIDDDWEDVRIDQIQPGDEILTLDEKTGKFVPSYVKSLMDMGIQQTYLLITESGKQIRTTSEHPYLIKNTEDLAAGGLFVESNIDQKTRDQEQTKSNSHFNIEVYQINHDIPFLNLYATDKATIANPLFIVNSNNFTGSWIWKAKAAARAAITHPAHRLTNNSDNIIKNTGSNLINNNLSQAGSWLKVSQIKPGMEVATIDGWEKIAEIKEHIREQVWDIEVENTHNFVGNNIVAHNTYLQGSLGIGDAFRGTTTPVNGLGIQGNLGVGTTTSNSTLSISGNAHIGSLRQGIAAPTDGLFVDGNVGIGATTSNNMLDVWGNSRLAGTLKIDAGTTIGFGGATAPTIGLAVNGNVGVGTSTANSTLSVAGNAHIGSIRQGIAGPTNGLFVDGNVGIGATTSSNPLDLWGAARITGTLTLDGNSLIGYGGASVTGPTAGLAVNGNVGVGTTTAQGALHVVGQCVAWDTRIRIRRRRRSSLRGVEDDEAIYDYLEVMIKDILPGDEVLSLNEVTQEFEYQRVEKLLDMGSKGVYEITTKSGKQIKTTANHPYLTHLRGEKMQLHLGGVIAHHSPIKDAAWVKVSQLKVGDQIAVTGFRSSDRKLRLSFGGFSLSFKSNINQNKNNKNQSISNSSQQINFNEIHDNFLLNKYPTNNDTIPQNISTVNIVNLNEGSIPGNTGLMIANPTQNTEKLINQSANTDSKVESIFPITPHSNIEGETLQWDEIVSIKYLGYEHVYDLQISNTHNFLANGIVAHNTYLQGSLGIGDAFRATTTPVNGLGIQGNLGVGTSTANSTLSVAGNAHIGSLRQGIVAPTNGLFVDGNVGIGATTSTNPLDVWGNARIAGTLTVDSSITVASCTGCGGGGISQVGSMTTSPAFGDSTADDDWLGLGSGAGRIEFQDLATDSINFLTTNVGIGFTTPDRLLQIAGDLSPTVNIGTLLGAAGSQLSVGGSTADTLNTKLVFGVDTTNNYSFIQAGRNLGVGNTPAMGLVLQPAGGNVGIGFTSPTSLLHVQGDGSTGTWTTNTNYLPDARSYIAGASVVANGYLYVIGGDDSAAANSSTVYYAKINSDGSTGTWTTNTNYLPGARSDVNSVIANGYVYVIGGNSVAATEESTVYYAKINSDGSTGTWSTNTNYLPEARNFSSSVVANGYLYVIGGDNASAANQSTVYYAKINSDGSTGTWSTNTNYLPGARSNTAALVANGYVYVIGGNSVANGEQSTVYYAKLNSDGSVGSFTTNTNYLPDPRNFPSAIVSNGYIYVLGGDNGSAANQSTVYYAKINSDGSTGTWSTNTNYLPVVRSSHASVIANGYVYVLGGDNPAATEQSTVYYAPLQRVSIQGDLDLLGLAGANVGDSTGDSSFGSVGGSIYAGNIFSAGALEVSGNSQFWNGAGFNGPVNIGVGVTGALASPALSITGGLTVLGTSTNTFTINSAGNVGIATTSPSQLFQVNYSSSNPVVITSGGNVGVGFTSPLSLLHVQGNGSVGTWTTNSNYLPGARYSPGMSVVANGYIYVVGGSTNGAAANTQSTVFYAKLNSDGSTGTWTTNSNYLPRVRQLHSTIVANGYLYVIGGNDTAAQSTVFYAKLNSDGSTGTWTTNSNYLPVARDITSSVVANGYVYVIGGGSSGSFATGKSTVYYAKLNSDGSVGTWTTNSIYLPENRVAASTIVANGYVYVIGGNSDSTLTSTVYYAKLNSDGSVGTWTTNSIYLPENRVAASTIVANGYVYVIGGGTNTAASSERSTVFYAKIKSDGSVGTWSTNTTYFPVIKANAGTVVANGYVYVIGGASGANSTVYYAPLQRVSISGNLDLLGLSGANLGDSTGDSSFGSMGGSIYAGNIFSAGALEVSGNSQFWQGAGFNGPVNIGVGASSPSTGQAFTINGNTTLTGPLKPFFTIQNDGNVGIGMSNPTATLQIASDATCIDSSSSAACSINDYAELYPSLVPTEKGDLLVIDPASDGKKPYVKPSDTAYQGSIVGIVTSDPAIVIEGGVISFMGGPTYKHNPYKPGVALAGRVPVKISTENGPINVGDYLTSSSTPGVAMKATRPGQVVGKALESYQSSAISCQTNTKDGLTTDDCIGKILTFVNVSYADPNNFFASLSFDSEGNLVIPKIKAGTLTLDSSIASASASLSVIPADAGIHLTTSSSEMDPRLRGDDGKVFYDLTGKIASLESRVKSLESRVKEVDTGEATSSATPSTSLADQLLASASSVIASGAKQSSSNLDLTPPDILLASGSATLADISITSDANIGGKLSTYDLNISNSLKSLGGTTLGKTTIAGDLTVDGTLSIENGSEINVIGTLFLQKSSLAEDINLFAGKVTIDKNGNIKTLGEVAAASIVTNKLTISNTPIASSSAILGTTIGTATLPANKFEVTVTTTEASSSAKIFITPTTPTDKVLSVTNIQDGLSFDVTTLTPSLQDINFNWWVVTTQR